MKIVSLCEYPRYLETVADWMWHAFYEKDRPGVPIDAVRAKLYRQEKGTLPHTYLALSDGACVGTVTLYENDLKGSTYTPWLGSLFVPSEQRGRGIARAMITQMRDIARSRGADRLYLRTEHTASYYEMLGWRFVERTVDPAYQMETTVYDIPLSGFRVERVPDDPWQSVRLFDDECSASATVACARGGILTSLFIGGRELLYLEPETLCNPEKSVRGGCPILFPSCGRLRDKRYTWEGTSYAMNIHGLARNHPWLMVENACASGASLTISLTANEATRREYPFDFRIFYTYTLRDGALSVTQRFENTGTRAMPFSSGLHPYFRADQTRSEARLSAKEYLEVSDNTTHRYDGITRFASGAEIITEPLRCLDARLATGFDYDVCLHCEGSYRYYVLWSPKDAAFACVEPWTARPNALNTREDLLMLAPGETTELVMEITVSEKDVH